MDTRGTKLHIRGICVPLAAQRFTFRFTQQNASAGKIFGDRNIYSVMIYLHQ